VVSAFVSERWDATERVMTIAIGDVVEGDVEEALDIMQIALHDEAERSVGPMTCHYVTFGSADDVARDLFDAFLRTTDLPAEAIEEYLAAWDKADHPVACIHWGDVAIPGIQNARLN
jgi:hypothetical protein